jgi:hypothetical protein
MASAGDGGEMLLELLGTVGQGMADSDKYKDCVGNNRANLLRCNSEMEERQNRYSEQVQRRTSERERLKEEREAMAACEREQDPDRYARCVRSRLP